MDIQKTIRVLNEIYSEPEISTFTHENKQYDLNAILIATKNHKTKPVNVLDLIWLFEYDPMDDSDIARILEADLSAPILITTISENDQEKIVVLDGMHRLAKAVVTGKFVLDSINIDETFLRQYEIK